MGELKIVNQVDFGIQAFLDNQTSEHTRRAYAKDLADFAAYLKQMQLTITHPSQLTINHFLGYKNQLLVNLAPKTVHRKISAIKSLMNWFHLNGHVSNNPIASLKLPKAITQRPTQALSDEEVRKVFLTAESTLERFLVELFFKLGLRRSEVLSLTKSSFMQIRGHFIVRIQGKGMKVRELPLSEETIAILNKYLAEAQITDNLFEISDSTLYRIIKNLFKKCGISKDFSPHSCRATVISHLLDTQEVAIRDVADFAGHSNINTTSLYDKRRKGLDNSPSYKVNYGKV